MPGFFQVRTQPVATAGVPFSCSVFVFNGEPGDVVTVRLAQTAGAGRFYSARADVIIRADRGGLHVFPDVVLDGPGSMARLVADDISSAFPVVSGDAHIAVVAP